MPTQSQGKRRLPTHDLPAKRFRVSRACDACRTAREKCDGKQPVCEPCLEAKRGCAYTSNPKKRGLQPGYIRSLEMTLALVFQHEPDVEIMVNRRLAQQNSVLLARGTKESNRLHKSWAKSKFCRDVNRALSGGQIGSGDDKMPSSDEDSEVDVEQDGLFRVDTDPGFHSQQMPWIHVPELMPDMSTAALVSEQDQFAARPTRLDSKLTPLPADCWTLLDTYSTYTQCWLPISEKLDVLKLSYSYPEQGLLLSPDMTDAGSHAEMWSIFAVSATDTQTSNQESSPEQLYVTVKSLIPDEFGGFELGHVKALLNLAVFNIKRLRMEAAWRLVGAASRILPTVEKPMNTPTSRHDSVLSSCFLLDSILSLHLQRRPSLEKTDAAKIEEDGMDEWQPWSGALIQSTAGQSRTPALALSHFNGLLDVVDILMSTTVQSTARNFLHETIGRLEIWKNTLPSKFNYIRSDSAVMPMTPPAVLLQLTYLTTVFTLVPSSAWLRRILSLLNTLNIHLGFGRAPPLVVCLVQNIKRLTTNLDIDHATRIMMQQVFADVQRAFSTPPNDIQGNASVFTGTSPSIVQLQHQETNQTSPQSQQGGLLLPHHPPLEMSSTRQGAVINTLSSRPVVDAFDPSVLESSALDPLASYDAFMAGDLESFFDDLASLHGAKKLQNQPQFMQNLGYSSEIRMADLIATDSAAFDPGINASSLQFPGNIHYDAE